MTLKQVLVVEDSEDDQFITEHYLTAEYPDVEVTFAFDGVEALECLADSGSPSFDIILLDINMPRMNGLEFLAQYTERTPQEPPVVVMLSSSLQERDRAAASEFSCVATFLQKPLTRETSRQLADEVAKRLR